MKYWIIIDSWNLMETFITESLSPYNFYERRSFSNDLTRYINKEGSFTNLLLFRDEPLSEYAIQVDETLLNKELLTPVSKGKITCYSYPTTIYYKRGMISFRFMSENAIKSFVAESKIIIEVKTIEKYIDSFYIQPDTNLHPVKFDRTSSIPFNMDDYIRKDNLFNSIKGAIIAYTCGVLTNTSQKNQTLVLALNELKNQVAGLNTNIMISEGVIPNFVPVKKALATVQNIISSDNQGIETSVDVLRHIVNEILPLSIKRCAEIAKRKSPSYDQKLEQLKEKEIECSKKLDVLEDQNINEAKNELQQIKNLEVENGLREGKKRKFFPKGSSVYIRKKELQEIINRFKENNAEYKSLKHELKNIKDELSFAVSGTTQYDASLEALFTRFSDNINNILKTLKKQISTSEQTVTLDNIVFHKGLHIIEDESDIEYQYFDIVLNFILNNPNGKNSVVSDNRILDIISNTGKIFKEKFPSLDAKGDLILNTIRDYWQYKKQKKDNFSIPQDMPVLQAILSFFIKSRGFDQIERFMMNRAYHHKELAYMLCGCLMGYAALPKTLTSVIYSQDKQKIEECTETYLFNLLKEI